MRNEQDRNKFLEGCKKLNINISKEQMTRIDEYAFLLAKWQKVYNLIGPDTVSEIYTRHLLDSIQIVPYIKNDDVVIDVGAGAGLPSIVLAIMTDAKIYACEKVSKKVSFMNEVRRKLCLDNCFEVLQRDVYGLSENDYLVTVVTSRAFSEMNDILRIGEDVFSGCRYVLLKGEGVDDEIKKIKINNSVTFEKKQSITYLGGNILLGN